MPIVNDAPLPPAMKMTLVKEVKFDITPYGPSSDAINDFPGFLRACAWRSLVKPSYEAITSSKGFVEAIVKGCDSVDRIPGIQRNT